MHAVVSTVTVDNVEEARALLASARVSLVARAPGLVCAYWLEPIDGIGMSMLVFDSEQHAREAAAYPVPPMAGVKLTSMTIREVFGHV